MSLVDVLDFLAVVLNVILLTVYFYNFSGERVVNKYVSAVIYVVAITLYYCSSVYLPEAYQKTIAAILVYMLLSTIWRGSFLFKLLLVVFFTSLSVMIETIVAFFLTMFSYNIYRIPGESTGYMIGLCLSNLFIVIVWGTLWVLWKKKLSKSIYVKKLETPQWSALFLALLLITLVISYSFDYLTIKRDMDHGLMYFILLECLLIIFDIGIFYIFQKMERLQQEKLKSALVFQQNEAQQAFYKESIQKNQQLKKIVHDEKNFLLGVEGYLKNGEINAALAEVERQRKQLMSTITDYTGNIALDTVLTAKVEEARKQGITIQPVIMLYGQIMIDFLDLVLLLGNALDNAIEATEAVVQIEEKKIWLTMKLQQNILHIQVENPVVEPVVIENQTIVSGKKEQELHGFGISNMKTITKKYHGTFDIRCSDKLFVLNIVLENVKV